MNKYYILKNVQNVTHYPKFALSHFVLDFFSKLFLILWKIMFDDDLKVVCDQGGTGF